MPRSVLASILAVAAALVMTPAVRAAPAQAVAIGDSYMAGIGAGSYTVTNDCRRSSRSYAADATRRAKATLTDLSCPGARVPQVLVQASNVPATASTVLVQVGGNDVGFSSLALSCLAPGGSTCLQDVEAAIAGLPALSQGLASIAAEVRARAPQARLVFAGYPALLSTPRQCAKSAVANFIDATETAAIIGLQNNLDATIAAAAAAAGADFVDWPRSVNQHSLCSPTPWYVTPLSGPIQDSLHPIAKAYAAMGRPVSDLLRR